MSASARVEPRYLPAISRDNTVLDLVAPAEPENFERALYGSPIVDGRRLPSLARRMVKAGWTLKSLDQRRALAAYLEMRVASGVDEDEAKEEIIRFAFSFVARQIHEAAGRQMGRARSVGGRDK